MTYQEAVAQKDYEFRVIMQARITDVQTMVDAKTITRILDRVTSNYSPAAWQVNDWYQKITIKNMVGPENVQDVLFQLGLERANSGGMMSAYAEPTLECRCKAQGNNGFWVNMMSVICRVPELVEI